MTTFRALRVFDDSGLASARIVEMGLDELEDDAVLVKGAYSGLNYKDALSIAGRGKIIRKFPLVPGCDYAGTVVRSRDQHFKEGDAIVLTGFEFGGSHNGGFAGYACVPADWLVKLPTGLSPFDAMTLGTAGYTAALAVHLLQQNGVTPDKGRIAVNGATGGTASIGINMLSTLGYRVVAITGKKATAETYLRALGAAEVLERAECPAPRRPLESPLWAGALDSVGGDGLAYLIATMQRYGVIASFGNTGGNDLKTSVLPFILRGVRLVGTNANSPPEERALVWERLASDLKPPKLTEIATTIALDDLPGAVERMLAGHIRGRMVVRLE
jgi:putative YhdH/YhfP family quinone oxidoreductase